MYLPLVPCPSCARHVRTSEATCPFCASDLPLELHDRVAPEAPARLNRAAWFVFGATLTATAAAGVQSCGGDVTTEPRAAGGSAEGQGGAGGEATSSGSGGDGGSVGDGGGAVSLYGTPPPRDGGPPDDDGGRVDLYGAPPPDAG